MQSHLDIVEDNGDAFLQLVVAAESSKISSASNHPGVDESNSVAPAIQILEDSLDDIEDMLCSGKTIFPLKSLRTALREPLVERLLIEMGKSRRTAKNQAVQICSKYCRILAVLIKIGKPQSISAFLEEQVDDTALPLKISDYRFCIGKKTFSIPGWKRFNYQSFIEFQQTCLTPFLARPNGRVRHYKLGIPPWFLPIIERKSINATTGTSVDEITAIVPAALGEGAQGVVTAIKLHPSSCQFDTFPVR